MPGYLPAAILSLVRHHLEESEHFYRDVEGRYTRKLNELDKEYNSRPKAYWDEGPDDFGSTRGDEITNEYQHFKGMQALNREFGVITVYAEFEQFLFIIFWNAKLYQLLPASIAARQNLSFKGYVDMLKGLDIDLAGFPGTYGALNRLREIRNAIVHHGARVTSHNIAKLAPYGFKEEGFIEIDDTYFFQARELVCATAQTILKQYADYLKKKGLM